MKRWITVCITAIILSVFLPLTALASDWSASQVRASMLALQDEYYEGRAWTNDDKTFYSWQGGGECPSGYGGMAFAYLLSDAAFGSLPSRKISNISYDEIRVGDILRINGDTHSVIILYKYNDHVVVAEGNYTPTIHWGREMSVAEVLAADYCLTRYPEGIAPQVETAPQIVAQPLNARVKEGNKATFEVVAMNATGYQWYYMKPGETTWNKVSNNGTSATYSLTTASRHDGYKYRCKVTDSDDFAYSDVATLTIAEDIKILRQPDNITVKEGETAAFTVKASGKDELFYQWFYWKSDENGPGTVVSNNGNAATYSVKTEARHDGYSYCCIVYDLDGYAQTKCVTLTVIPASKPSITNQPKSISVEAGSKATFSVTATGGKTYQWYYQKPNETTWKEVSIDGTSATYTLTAESRHNGNKYRCKVMNGAGAIYSNTVTLTVLSEPVITTQPRSASVEVGNTATFMVEASGAKGYQWYYRASPDGEWTAVKTKGNATTYSVITEARHNGYQYRCQITNDRGTVYSDTVTLTVWSEPIITVQPKDASVKMGDTATFKVAAIGAAGYQWYYRTSADGEWTAVKTNGTSATYTISVETRHNGYQYRCLVKNSRGAVYTDTVTLTVSK